MTKTYDYDAFGVEQSPSATDTNPYRYCGEYYDTETGTYYLRARYYSPSIGRFTQEDTHWNIGNMIYGDEPVKWNEREANSNDRLGLKAYTYLPDMAVIRQNGNLYIYALCNPVGYIDWNGEIVTVYELDLSGGAGIYGKLFYGYVIDDQGNSLEYIGRGIGGGFGASAGLSVYKFNDMDTVDDFENASIFKDESGVSASVGVGILAAGGSVEFAGDSFAASGSLTTFPKIKIGSPPKIKAALSAYATINKSVIVSKQKAGEGGKPYEFHRWS